MVLPLISSSPSSSSRSTRMRNLKNSISTLGVNVNRNNFSSAVSSKASQNGIGVVFNRSNCGYPYFRSYGWGGEIFPTNCGHHLLNCDQESPNCSLWNPASYGWNSSEVATSGNSAGENFTWADIIWYGEYAEGVSCGISSCSDYILRTLQNKRSGTPAEPNHNWRGIELKDYEGPLSAGLRRY